MNWGLHFGNKYWESPTEEDFARLRLARPECIKTCLFPDPPPSNDQVETHRRLAREHPSALIVARLFANMGDTAWTVDKFVSDFSARIEAVRPHVRWFEVHNEPNLDKAQAGYAEGFGPTDHDFMLFRVWIDEVLDRLRAEHSWAKWVFPGNAVHRQAPFWQALLPSIRRFDAWGVHCYWQFDNHRSLDFGRCYERAHDLLPDMPLIITECGDSTLGRSPSEKIARYLEWSRDIDAKSYVLGTAFYILGGTQDWTNRPGRPNFEVTRVMAQALGDASRQPSWPLLSEGFDFPVAKPDGHGYYIAAGVVEEPYRERWGCWHTGEDWNDLRLGDSDLGAPVYAVAHGRVVTSGYFRPSWGNIVLIEHLLPDGRTVWSQYGHLLVRCVDKGDIVRRGERIGTIGKGDGQVYPAHLHFEIRTRRLPASKWGWKTEEDRERLLRCYARPSAFIEQNRPGQTAITLTVDDQDPGFERSDSEYWYAGDVGFDGRCWWTWTVGTGQSEDCVAVWTPQLPRSGLYEVYAYIPRRYASTRHAQYLVRHARGETTVAVVQNDYYDEWTSLGTYTFSVQQDSYVRLSDVTGEPYSRDRALRHQIAFDAIMWVLVEGE